MQNNFEEKTVVRIFATLVVVALMILVLNMFRTSTSERIADQNESYVQNSTIETAQWIKDVLESAESSINNTARLYGQVLASGEIDVEELENIAEASMFDYVEFIEADGTDINVQEEVVDVSERSYYARGMRGESGMDGAYTSKTTGERLVIFFAPVRRSGEIIGVLTGHYREERMQNILNTTMFGHRAPTVLCLPDGTVVCGNDIWEDKSTLRECMQGCVSDEEWSNIENAVSTERECAFSYKTDSGETRGYIASLPGNVWTLVQLFPEEALTRMQSRANRAGLVLQVQLVVMFAAYIIFLMMQERYQKKKLYREKRQAEQIVNGINRLFNRVIYVNLKEDTYQYVNDRLPGYIDLPPNGRYEDWLAFFDSKFVPENVSEPVSVLLRKESIRRILRKEGSFERYEYRIERDGTNVWENMAVIGLEWKDKEPVSVLLAVQDITLLKQKEQRTQDALREAFQSARSANRAKSEFLSRMSHDIRTPMNAIMGMTAIAEAHITDPLKLQDCFRKIDISSKHLLGLINEVLDMSKIESGKLELIREEFGLSELINNLLGLFHSQIDGKNQTLSVTLSNVEHEKVIGDSQRLSQVLVNIMGNAVKYTPEGGELSLHIGELPTRVAGNGCYEFIITDTGIGMDPEFAARIFEPFARAADERTSKTEGTGLGMTIAKNIVTMMNGDIQVKSKKGEGTQIKVDVFLEYVDESEEKLDALAGRRVLIVDDEEAVCENVTSILAGMHMPSAAYQDGDEALKAFAENMQSGQKFEAVIVDWRMPGKDGMAVTRGIRELGWEGPVIILSSYDWAEIEKEALEAGATTFVSKPLFKSRLVYVMKKVLLGEEPKAEKEPLLRKEEQFLNKKLLLVEDNEMNMEIAAEILTMAGFEVDGAENGKIAVSRLEGSAPGTYQAVLMDIQMPVMNGYEATIAIRASEREDLKQIPIFALTADAFSADIRKAEEAGMNGHISKPIDIVKLLEALKSCV